MKYVFYNPRNFSVPETTYEIRDIKNHKLSRAQLDTLDKIDLQSEKMHKSWEKSTGLHRTPDRKSISFREQLKNFNKDGSFLVLAFQGDEPVGYCFTGGKSPYYRDTAWVDNIAVEESCRGQGIGKRILREAVSEIRKRGIRHILLKVDDMNTVAMNMYSSFGFKTWGRTMLLNLN